MYGKILATQLPVIYRKEPTYWEYSVGTSLTRRTGTLSRGHVSSGLGSLTPTPSLVLSPSLGEVNWGRLPCSEVGEIGIPSEGHVASGLGTLIQPLPSTIPLNQGRWLLYNRR